jgi:HlyD family secretion protein
MRRWLLVVVPVLIVAAVAAAVYYPRDGEAPGLTPATVAVRRGDLAAEVSATGTLSPRVEVQVGSQVSGTLHRIHVDFNSPVHAGQLIAEIEPSLIAAAVAQAEANAKSAVAAREKAAVAVQDAQRRLDRQRKLSQEKIVSDNDLDAAEFAVEAARAEERVQMATVGQRQAALEQARVDLAHTRIYAPIDGIVISRDVDVGQTVAASLQTPTLFVIAGDLDRMQIETEVDEAFIGQLAEGQPVTFTVFAYPERTFRGQLAQVRLNPTVEAGVVKYNCIIHVDNPDHALKPGMTATVAIEVDRHDGVLQVPNGALRFVPEPLPAEAERLRDRLGRNQAIVWLAGADRLRPVIVTTGLVGEEHTEVAGEAIAEGVALAVPGTPKDMRRERRRPGRLF